MKRRAFQVTCHCDSYPFPHRLGGGKCNGSLWAEQYALNVRLCCSMCNALSLENVCEVASGQEDLGECEAINLAYRREFDPTPFTTPDVAELYEDRYEN